MRSLSGILNTRRGSISDWTSSAIAGEWHDVAYGNGTWVIVGKDNKISYNEESPYSAWSSAASPLAAGAFIKFVIYAQNYFVAVAISDSRNIYAVDIITSPDGINWTKNASSTNLYVARGLATDGNKIIINAQYGSNSSLHHFNAISPTGAWTIQGIPVCGGGAATHSIFYGGGYWVYMGFTHISGGIGNIMIYSLNGTTWTCKLITVTPFPDSSANFTYDGTRWIAAGWLRYYISNATPLSWSCENFVIPSGGGQYASPQDIEYGNGRFVIADCRTGTKGIYYYDGTLTCGNYFTRAAGASSCYFGVHYNNNYWVGVGRNQIAVAGPGL